MLNDDKDANEQRNVTYSKLEKLIHELSSWNSNLKDLDLTVTSQTLKDLSLRSGIVHRL